ncbi:acyl carrier protein [Kitasatospora sp. NPDC059599]|uniref:acyl carrier protein n=1 Tax=Kitasatospora sp. NPDC059599 TaxID=3346880 RepID=UPI00367B2DF2
MTDDPRAVARFAAEARKLARLHHRGIVTVHDAGTLVDNGHVVPYLVMELLNGSTWLQRTSVEAAVRTGASLAGALAHMHEMEIVHGDIKPANIMICVDGQAVLMDLGIAREFSTLTTVTATGSPGTLVYMAPEQLAGAPASAASDVYALGLVLTEKITGKRGPAAQLPATDQAALAPRLHALLVRMTALEPGGRPNMAECQELLGQSDVSQPPAPEPPQPEPVPEVPGRRPWWARLFSPQHRRPRNPAPQTAASAGERTSTSTSAAQKEVLAAIAGIINEIAGIPVKDVQPDQTFSGDLDVDSLSMVEAVVVAEERFGIRIPDSDARDLRTVRDATTYIVKALRSR